jgi:cell division protein FtsI/penicillin-binding protein 2
VAKFRILNWLLALAAFVPALPAVTPTAKKSVAKTATKAAPKTAAKKQASAPKAAVPVRRHVDPTEGDVTEGEDFTVRQAAVEALGNREGTIVVTEADSGRILTVVNQKLAFKSGFQPCSTVKIPVALAALSESLVDRDTQIRLTPRGYLKMAMTQAIATSNNDYFARLGEKLGFERVSRYARMYGLGEKAAMDLPEEQPGILPAEKPKEGVGMMTSFGSGISLTPLEFASLLGAVANGGTLYYLQYPKTQQEAEAMIPRVKRQLDIENQISSVRPGMMGAVEYGTAKRAGFDPNEPIYGKTGTCTDPATWKHLGWFGSFSQMGDHKLVVVVLLTGSKTFSGPVASGVAGEVYKSLGVQNSFALALD